MISEAAHVVASFTAKPFSLVAQQQLQVFYVQTSLRSVCTTKNSGQYSPIRPSRLVGKEVNICPRRHIRCSLQFRVFLELRSKWRRNCLFNLYPLNNFSRARWFQTHYVIKCSSVKTREYPRIHPREIPQFSNLSSTIKKVRLRFNSG